MADPLPIVKVTRQRQRMSMEAEEVKSPLTPSTPTKKRGGRLATKPQLELIDEIENPPKRSTRKSIAKETEPMEEKVITPSRRSTRIRSNTSLVSEPTQSLNSPRAKRAARRNSQIGSDNESTLTPTRLTRRTRKDSTSSIDKPIENIALNKIDDIIVEEKETNNMEEDTKNIQRKSPRLRKKIDNSALSNVDTIVDTQNIKTGTSNSSPTKENSNEQTSKSLPTSSLEYIDISENTVPSLSSHENINTNNLKTDNDNEIKERLSVSSSNLIKTMSVEPKKVRDFFNKSTSNVIELSKFKSKRQRTKSFTPDSKNYDKEAHFLSDNEGAKKKIKNKTIDLNNYQNSGDGFQISINSPMKPQDINLNSSQNRPKMAISLSGDINESIQDNTSENKKDSSLTSECEIMKSTTLLLQKDPSEFQIKCLVYDTDSNSSKENKVTHQHLDSEDQCVPVVHTKANDSCEPMDIDETIPGNNSIHYSSKSNGSNESRNNEDNKSELTISEDINNSGKRLSTTVCKNQFTDDLVDKSILSEASESNKNVNKMETDLEILKNLNGSSKKNKQKISSSSVFVEDCVEANKTILNSSNNALEDSFKSISNSKSSQRKSSFSMFSVDNKNSYENLKHLEKQSIISTNPEFDNVIIEDINLSTRKSKRKSNNMVMETCDDNMSDSESKRKSSINIISDDSENSTKFKRESEPLNNNTSNNYADANKNSKKSDRKSSLSISDYSDTIIVKDKLNRKSSLNEPTGVDSTTEEFTKYKGKHSLSQNDSTVHLENSNIKNKSTLILSQIKDTSCETNRDMKTPKKNNSFISKSMDMNITKDNKTAKKSASLNCLTTSTPLQSKTLKNLCLPVDTSNVSLKNKSNIENSKSTRKEDTSIPKGFDESSDDESNSTVESSRNESELIDLEAEEASSDYQSGDSRDDEEREYEKSNAITEKGEALDSEEDFSDDTDYEKDSFIVSSDAEDCKLLSGTGDDLSMSDNELSMSKKSKKKYNKRKTKEQKKASREMYEARHRIDNSESSITKDKKYNRQRLESSSPLNSDDEIISQPKQRKRMRISSSHDTCNIECENNQSKSKDKNKYKRLSESQCNESLLNEKEMSICPSKETEKDPLLTQIKDETKTPLKFLNMSTVHVANGENIEEVQIDENRSITRLNETSDPLKASLVHNDSEVSSSENEEIIHNYNSVLENLSNVKSHSKVKLDTPKANEVNLTQGNSEKYEKTTVIGATNKINKSKDVEKCNKTQLINTETESSSSSIDMKLIFPDESNDSEVSVEKSKTNKGNAIAAEEYIPIKKSEGKTNISINEVNELGDEFSMKKAKKKKNAMSEKSLLESELDTKADENLGFFIDTKGTRDDSDTATDTLSKGSAKKNKRKDSKKIDDSEIDDMQVEILYSNEKIDKTSKNSLTTQPNIENSNALNSDNASVDVSLKTHKKKKKEKHISDNLEANDFNIITATVEVSPEDASQSLKKKKKSKHLVSAEDNIEMSNEIAGSVDAPNNSILEVSLKKEKKKKKQKQALDNSINDNNICADENHSLDTATQSPKNKKRVESSITVDDNIKVVNDTSNEPERTKKRKNKKSFDGNDIENQKQLDVQEENSASRDENCSTSKKRKRKGSGNPPVDLLQDEPKQSEKPQTPEESCSTGNRKKKRKVMNVEGEDTVAHTDNNDHQNMFEENQLKKTKNNKKLNQEREMVQTQELESIKPHRSQKRKARHEDGDNHAAKVPRHEYSEKLHVRRLPDFIISQLSDKQQINIKSKSKYAIATTPFVIEETARKPMKPSHYLEESVYLNEPPKSKKQKSSHKNPKVLPFIPTATTSYKGFTTDFKVKILEKDTQFVAQANDVQNFKNEYLQKHRIKKLGTFEKYKKNITAKLSKF